MHKTGIAKRWANGAAVAALGLSVAACEQIEGLNLPFSSQQDGATGADNLAPAAASDGETRDVEAPEVFQKSEAGLWDGRPSLGGVWVAHPDVTDPERVIIRNEDNGRFVVGALFRRERDNPGPSLQVSSDAAEELGMLAGAPSSLNVVALRREEVAVTPPATTDFDAPVEGPATGLAAPADISATPLDDVTSAPAAAAVAAPATATANGAAATVDAIAIAAAAVQTAESAAGIDAPLPDPASPLGAPLDARGPVSDGAALPAPTQASSSLEKPFIQIGIFSVEANANETAGKLRSDGMSASVVEQDSQGKTFWRVLVGPAPNAQDRTAILAKIQALGFSDAYFVTN